MTAETNSCLADFAREHPHYLELLMAGPAVLDETGLTHDEFNEATADGEQILGCMTDEEYDQGLAIIMETLSSPAAIGGSRLWRGLGAGELVPGLGGPGGVP